jgi:hypothetical protein
MTMPRSDLAVSFAGKTLYAYPLIIQLASAIANYPKSRSRAMDIHDLKGYSVKMFNQLLSQIDDLPKGQDYADPPEAQFILGGYSWRKKRFVIWLIHFDPYDKRFVFRPTSRWKGGNNSKLLCLAGDYVEEAKAKIVEKLRAKSRLSRGGFDMEPFEVLRDLIRSEDHPLVGGPPQLLKVQGHMNCTPYAVYWPDRQSGRVALLGRQLFDYEISDNMILDPDTLTFYGRESSSIRALRVHETLPDV